jgi:hypothetical protein
VASPPGTVPLENLENSESICQENNFLLLN